ncbi:uncharacterized membrane protein HdeD (DUF308 family) [Chitinophaga skermanii]|uniref:Uncharacterized membrane protein HdeD (DUF308 family) n=1 Tax=Chitinophaga skermanii TaxID=331697 RepID=A0A327QD91_9BACT|nr:HdeD family acid-resistance protein [Chitinophaga skermanii]RAJ02539.1 uncharacterized membrane protein HdeD (DUF308 family) [Chitinophaga skermanii]
MLHELAKNWWLFVLRGVFAIIFGLIAFFWPGITLTILTIFLGAYLLVDGIFTFIYAFQVKKQESQWWVYLLEGLLGVAAGILILSWPGITALYIVFLVAFWAIVTGILEIIAAIRLRKVINNEWMLILAGILSIIFGVLIFSQPITGAVVIAWWIGIYAILFGVMLISVGVKLNKYHKSHSHSH